jgi:hypothetical protein
MIHDFFHGKGDDLDSILRVITSFSGDIRHLNEIRNVATLDAGALEEFGVAIPKTPILDTSHNEPCENRKRSRKSREDARFQRRIKRTEYAENKALPSKLLSLSFNVPWTLIKADPTQNGNFHSALRDQRSRYNNIISCFLTHRYCK